MKGAEVEEPSATAVPSPAETVATSLETFCQGVTALTSSLTMEGGGTATEAAAGLAFLSAGAGHSKLPDCKMMDFRTTSSCRSMLKVESLPMDKRNLMTLFEYRVELWVGRRDGRSV